MNFKIILLLALALADGAYAARNEFIGVWIRENNDSPIAVVNIDANFVTKIDQLGQGPLITYGTTTAGTASAQHSAGVVSFTANGRQYIGVLSLGGLTLSRTPDKNVLGLVFFEALGQPGGVGNLGQYISFRRRLIIVDPRLPASPAGLPAVQKL